MSVEHSLLGKDTQYPTQYQPEVLFPISRAESRQQYLHVEGITQGKDWWHVFEISKSSTCNNCSSTFPPAALDKSRSTVSTKAC